MEISLQKYPTLFSFALFNKAEGRLTSLTKILPQFHPNLMIPLGEPVTLYTSWPKLNTRVTSGKVAL
jgi:hypothetical protein